MHELVGGAGSADSCSRRVLWWVGLVVQAVAHDECCGGQVDQLCSMYFDCCNLADGETDG